MTCCWVQITPVRPLMEQDWPSYYGPDETFWAHEWEKHGTCAEDVFPTQLDYFNTTLALHVANPIEVLSAHAAWLHPPKTVHNLHVRGCHITVSLCTATCGREPSDLPASRDEWLPVLLLPRSRLA